MVPMINVTEVQRNDLNAITIYDRLPHLMRSSGLSVNRLDVTIPGISLLLTDRIGGLIKAAMLRIFGMSPRQAKQEGHGASTS